MARSKEPGAVSKVKTGFVASANGRTARTAFAVLLAGALAIAFSPIFVRLSELGPTATAFHRVFLALPALWLWSHLDGRQKHPPRRPSRPSDYGWLILCGLFFAADLAVWHWSILFTSVANSTLIANLAPIFVALGSFVLFQERFTKTFLSGMAVAMAGVGLLMGESFTVSLKSLLGDALALVTAFFYAAYILAVGRLRARFSTAVIMSWSSLAAASALLPAALLAGEELVASTVYGWAVLFGLALISQAGGQSLIAYALAHLPAAFSSVSLLAQPVAATALAWIILAEPLSPWQGLGAMVTLAGILLARRGSW
jgi:drug/metabolite transporter (DMT)-like permease